MIAFGIQVNRHSIPFLYLACIPIAFLLLRQSYPAFWPSISTRAITVFLEVGFVFIALPSLYTLKKWKVNNTFLVIISLWLTWSAFSTIIGDYPWGGIVRWSELLTNIIFGLCLYLLIQERPQFRNLALYSIILSLIFSLIIYLGLWFTLENPYIYEWVATSPFFNNIRHYGYFIATALPLGYWLLEKNNNQKCLALVYLSLAWGLLFWSGGRGALLGVLIATALYFLISPKNIKWVAPSIAIGAILSQFFIVQSNSLNLFHALSWFSSADEATLNDISANRIKIYTDSIIYWWHNSPFFGMGADAFRYIKPSINGISQPHSIIIQLVFSYGIIGFLIPILLFSALTFSILRSNSRQAKVIYLCIISATGHALTDGVFYHAYSLLILSTLIAICLPTTERRASSYFTVSSVLIFFSLFINTTFSIQIIQSKDESATKQWITWNMKYPLYFSPENWIDSRTPQESDKLIEFALSHSENKCWFYSRHSDPLENKLTEYCQ